MSILPFNQQIFRHPGEMSTLINNYPWEEHELGMLDEWPPLLRSTLSLMLDSQFPMFLYWGPRLLCFYNDAFRSKLASDRHPAALGRPASEVWPEVWSEIEQVISEVYRSGGSVYNEDHYAELMRNGKLESSYWTYSYSPVRSDSGEIRGVLSVCIETTERVVGALLLRQKEEELTSLFQQAPVGILLIGREGLVIDFVNSMYLQLVGRDASCLGQGVWDVLPEIAAQGYDRILANVFDTGIPFRSSEQRVDIEKQGRLIAGYFTFAYEPVKDFKGEIKSVMVIVVEVTEQVKARQKVEFAEERVRLAVEVNQLGTFDYNLLTDEIETSERFRQIWGYVYHASHESLVRAIHPEDLLIRERAHRKAYSTGHLSYQVRIFWKNNVMRWIKVEGKVFYDSERVPVRMIGTVEDITEEKELKDSLTKTASSLQLALRAGKLGWYEYDVNSGRIDCNEQCKANFGLLKDDGLNFERLVSMIIPSDRKSMMNAVENSFKNNLPYETEYHVKWYDDTIHHLRASGLPVFDSKGRPAQMVGVTLELLSGK
jgi:PAS domain S-box-containing protein